MKTEMKNQTRILIVIGSLCMGFNLLTRHFFETPPDLADFIKGLGAAFLISSLLVQRKLERRHSSDKQI